jgi:citrate lyase subunit beta/citryl-CoA lyase
MTFDLGPAILFCPADRPERYEKAAERADAVILDLEDAVRPDDKPAARAALAAQALDPSRTIVRVSPVGTPDHALDMAVVRATAYRTIMLAKTEDAADLDALTDFEVVAICETARGVVQSSAIAAHGAVVALMWGAEDLVASLGGTSSRRADGSYRAVAAQARSTVLLAAGAAGKAAIDTVHVDIPDLAGLEAEAQDAAASGFVATGCIHPSQVAVVRRAYAPSDEELAFARELLDAASRERGVFTFRGAMVDEPVLRHARKVLARAL